MGGNSLKTLIVLVCCALLVFTGVVIAPGKANAVDKYTPCDAPGYIVWAQIACAQWIATQIWLYGNAIAPPADADGLSG